MRSQVFDRLTVDELKRDDGVERVLRCISEVLNEDQQGTFARASYCVDVIDSKTSRKCASGRYHTGSNCHRDVLRVEYKSQFKWKEGGTYKRGNRESREIKSVCGVRKRERKMNPLGYDGKPKLCFSCGSFLHFVVDCPDSWENSDRRKVDSQSENEVIIMRGRHSSNVMGARIQPNECCVLDAMCGSTVAGQRWLDDFLGSLGDSERRKVTMKESSRIFEFDTGERLQSNGIYCVPAVIASKKVLINIDAVERDIPLVLSKASMERGQMKIDDEHLTVDVFGVRIRMGVTMSGHYCVAINGGLAKDSCLMVTTQTERQLLKQGKMVCDSRDHNVDASNQDVYEETDSQWRGNLIGFDDEGYEDVHKLYGKCAVRGYNDNHEGYKSEGEDRETGSENEDWIDKSVKNYWDDKLIDAYYCQTSTVENWGHKTVDRVECNDRSVDEDCDRFMHE